MAKAAEDGNPPLPQTEVGKAEPDASPPLPLAGTDDQDPQPDGSGPPLPTWTVVGAEDETPMTVAVGKLPEFRNVVGSIVPVAVAGSDEGTGKKLLGTPDSDAHPPPTVTVTVTVLTPGTPLDKGRALLTGMPMDEGQALLMGTPMDEGQALLTGTPTDEGQPLPLPLKNAEDGTADPVGLTEENTADDKNVAEGLAEENTTDDARTGSEPKKLEDGSAEALATGALAYDEKIVVSSRFAASTGPALTVEPGVERRRKKFDRERLQGKTRKR